MVDIFQEVEEDLQRERAEKLWRKYGKIVIGVAVLIVVLVAGREAWLNYERTTRLAEGARFSAALALTEGGTADPAAALAALEAVASDSSSGYEILARLRAAALRAEQGDLDGARADYRALAERGDIPATYRDLARLLEVMIGFDTAALSEVDARLAPLRSPENPWRYTATELTALAKIKAGDGAAAATLLQSLADDPAAPGGVRARASELLQAVGG